MVSFFDRPVFTKSDILEGSGKSNSWYDQLEKYHIERKVQLNEAKVDAKNSSKVHASFGGNKFHKEMVLISEYTYNPASFYSDSLGVIWHGGQVFQSFLVATHIIVGIVFVNLEIIIISTTEPDGDIILLP